MNCSICGKSDKSMEVFHLTEDMQVATCMTCMKAKEKSDNCPTCGSPKSMIIADMSGDSICTDCNTRYHR